MKIKKRKYFAACNVIYLNAASNVSIDPSVTEPDQSLTIQEILRRVSEGKTTGLTDLPSECFDDDDDNDFDDPTIQPGFDKLDMAQLSTSAETEDNLDRISRYKSKKHREQREQAIEAEVQRRLQEQQKEPQE